MGKELFNRLVELKEQTKQEIADCTDIDQRKKLLLRLEDIKEHILLIKQEYRSSLFRK